MAGCGFVRYGWSVRGLAGWLGATTASAAIAWAALQPVLDTAVPDRFTPLTDAQLRAEPTATPSAADLGVPVALGSTPAAVNEQPDDAPTSAAESDSPDQDESSPAAEPTEPVVPAGEPEINEDGWTVIESESGTSYIKTFETDGGTATIEVEPGLATLLSATPTEPYAVDVYHEDPARVVVQFYVTDHMYVVEAMWWENRAYGNISEVPE